MKTKFLLIPFLVAVTNGLFAQYEILDNTFGSYGTLITDFSATHEAINSVALQADGKIVVAGWSSTGFDDNFALARYNTNGTLDSSFGMDGKLTTSFGGFDQALSVAIQEDGKIVAAGFTNIGCPDFHFAIARYNIDGTLDNSFGSGGKLITSFNTNWAEAHSVIIQKDGKIVATGLTRMHNGYNVTNEDFALARYNSDGTLDSSFNSDGKLTTDFDSSIDVAYSALIQQDGKIVVAGYSEVFSLYRIFALARYNPDGTLDGTFGTGGKQTTEFQNSDGAVSVALQSDEKIVAVGYTGSDNSDFALARYNTDGSIDNTFGLDGKLTTAISAYDNDYARSVVIQSDGKIVVAGYSPSLYFNFVLVRYNSEGTLDTTFSMDGKLITNIGVGDDYVNSIALQTDGKIVAVGDSYNGTNYDFSLARYTTGGNVAIPELSGSGNSLLIFPNPTTGVFEIKNSSSLIETAEAFNLFGEKVFSNSAPLHSNSINLSSQPEGVYFLHLKTAEGIMVKKIVISR